MSEYSKSDSFEELSVLAKIFCFLSKNKYIPLLFQLKGTFVICRDPRVILWIVFGSSHDAVFQGVPVRVPFSKSAVIKSCLQILPFSCTEEACPSHSFCTVFKLRQHRVNIQYSKLHWLFNVDDGI